jgi:diguanylate cyclase (GGDEF)-like protein
LRTFRPGDHIFRWGGDEFLVVAPGLEIEAAESRMKTVRAALAKWRSGQVPCGLSVGIDRLEPGGRPDEALSRADAAMYADKHKRSTAV